MRVVYGRVTNGGQDRSKLIETLQQADCQQMFTGRADEVGKVRPGLEMALEHMVEGDTLVVWCLAHLGRSLKQVIDIVNRLAQKGFGVQSLQEDLDTSAEDGQVILHVLSSWQRLSATSFANTLRKASRRRERGAAMEEVQRA